MATTLNPTYVQQITSDAKNRKRSVDIQSIARVTHVVQGPFLGNTMIPDKYYKVPTDIGNITFQMLIGNQDRTQTSAGNNIAKPINSALKHVPVEGEFVLIHQGPSVNLNDNRGQIEYYYTLPIDLWGASHHNALPDLGDVSNYYNQTTRTYEQNQATNQPTNLSTTGSEPYPLSPNFPEKSNIKQLMVFTGDVTLEGRWGNSIRFGSTKAGNRSDNYWSETGSAGSPITIIRNGQGQQLDPTPWVPTIENINRDPSSIYLTAGQKIVIDDIQNNFPLTSWQVALESTTTIAIPLEKQLTSYDLLSPSVQDNLTSGNV